MTDPYGTDGDEWDGSPSREAAAPGRAPELRPIGPRPSHRDASEEPPPPDLEPGPFGEPEPCPACGGRGVVGNRPDSFGNWEPCDVCEGSAIDPNDPASPL